MFVQYYLERPASLGARLKQIFENSEFPKLFLKNTSDIYNDGRYS